MREEAGYALFSVVLFKRVVDDSTAAARTRGFQVCGMSISSGKGSYAMFCDICCSVLFRTLVAAAACRFLRRVPLRHCCR